MKKNLIIVLAVVAVAAVAFFAMSKKSEQPAVEAPVAVEGQETSAVAPAEAAAPAATN